MAYLSSADRAALIALAWAMKPAVLEHLQDLPPRLGTAGPIGRTAPATV